ncbi:rhomboid family intramembrane serine protease [Jannaschia seohaensis]|uniref:Membrane associated rhomboid family serine protease n=1 Tax=Jannaschia seohaensis TaxID=475081 RepID=A0A2Y9B319_9RHOB|nr:rhomboid family intramembrane serine protease [Jannaschia seohaensis]PWJ16264.1 membrane associated rhomboid family serine protease [Jannaschia seohaensis]SSA49347.1 Membrane associated serine protease, rhomboid family [Jannaschia seohaensis]
MQDPRNQSPFNALPPEVVVIAVVIVGLEVMFQAGEAGFIGGAEAVGWRLTAIRDWSVIDPLFAWMWQNGVWVPREWARLFTYPLLHGSFGHAAFVVVFVLALGNAVAPVYRGWRLWAVFWGAALAGALAFLLLFSVERPLFGGYPAAYGLIGAFTLLTRKGLTRAPPDKAFLLVGFLLAIQPIFGLVGGQGLSWVPDWTADLAGFAAGYGIAVLLFPGEWQRIRSRMRQRR